LSAIFIKIILKIAQQLGEVTGKTVHHVMIGPVSHVVNAAGLHTVFFDNLILKYADDTCLIIPASNIQLRAAELQNVEEWSQINNLELNCHKTQEIIITGSKGKDRSLHSPPP